MKVSSVLWGAGAAVLAAGVALGQGAGQGTDRRTERPAARVPLGHADACAALLSQTGPGAFPDPTTRITSAVLQPATPAAKNAPAHSAHCEVLGTIDDRVSTVDGQRYAIKFHMRLPVAAKWNGRFFFQGGGGYNGNLGDAFGPIGGKQTADGLSMGFAVISTDSGHDNKIDNNPAAEGTFSFGVDPKARADFFYNAYGEVTYLGKALVRLYYGKAPEKSYFVGCSEGGREGMLMSQRYFDQYDGIVAGSPVSRHLHWSFSSIRNAQALASLAGKAGLRQADGAPAINKTLSDMDIDLVARAVLKACDGLDGLEDGMVSDPAACTDDKVYPRLDELVCKGAKTDSCLSADQVATIKQIQSPVFNAKGQELAIGQAWDPGMGGTSDKGLNTAWHAATLGRYDAPENSPARDSAKLTFIEQTFPMLWSSRPDPMPLPQAQKYILAYDYSQADPDPARNFPASGIYTAAPGLYVDTDSTDLTGFKAHGGKMILYHGAGDQLVPFTETARWYEAMNARMAASGFARFFAVPGMNDCGGGPATDSFDMLTPLMAWVEKGVAPDSITAEASAPSFFGVAHRSRPLCPWPQWPHYRGQGDVNTAASFVCSQT